MSLVQTLAPPVAALFVAAIGYGYVWYARKSARGKVAALRAQAREAEPLLPMEAPERAGTWYTRRDEDNERSAMYETLVAAQRAIGQTLEANRPSRGKSVAKPAGLKIHPKMK